MTANTAAAELTAAAARIVAARRAQSAAAAIALNTPSGHPELSARSDAYQAAINERYAAERAGTDADYSAADAFMGRNA